MFDPERLPSEPDADRTPSRPLFEPGSPVQVLLDAMAAMVFIVDESVTVLAANRAAAGAFGDSALTLRRLCGEVLRCLNSGVVRNLALCEPGPCGETESCKVCGVRQSARRAFEGEAAARRLHAMRLLVGNTQREAHFLVSSTPFVHEGQRLAMLILEDVTELTELQRLLPICAWCRRVRDGGDYRERLEEYLRKHTLLELSHGICPECDAKHFPESEPIAG